jgi:hypothetical protein
MDLRLLTVHERTTLLSRLPRLSVHEQDTLREWCRVKTGTEPRTLLKTYAALALIYTHMYDQPTDGRTVLKWAWNTLSEELWTFCVACGESHIHWYTV